MKKTYSKKLHLGTETLRTLSGTPLEQLVGAKATASLVSLCELKCPSAGVPTETGTGCGAPTALC